MKKLLWLGILLIGVFLINFAGQGELTCHYNLSGQLSSLYRKELVVNFSHDMVALGGERDGSKIVLLTPVAAGEFLWRGTKTLVFKPKTRFRYSTTYSIHINKGTRSRQGQVCKKTMSWTFTTPLAYPYECGGSVRKYYRRMKNNQSLPYTIRPNEKLLIRFDQAVSASLLQKYLNVRENDEVKAVGFNVVQNSKQVVALEFKRPLRRGKRFLISFEKGFTGVEGNQGTTVDFAYSFLTMPAFACSSLTKNAVFLDKKELDILFTNRLKSVSKELVTVLQIQNGQKNFFKDYRVRTLGKKIRITFGGSISSGDQYIVAINSNIKNFIGENLKEDLTVSVGVCSSQYPTFDFWLEKSRLQVDTKSIRKYRAHLYKFRDRMGISLFYREPAPGIFRRSRSNRYRYNPYLRADRYISKREKGFFTKNKFNELYIDQQKILNPFLETDRILTASHDIKEHLPWGLGFYGVTVDRITPYNVCQYTSNKSFWLHHTPYLEIFHNRNVEFVAHGYQGETLFWAYNKRTLQPLPDASILYSNHENHLGRTDKQGMFLWPKWLMPKGHVAIYNSKNDDDQAFVNLQSRQVYRKTSQPNKHILTIFCERGFYKPGETVHLGGVIKQVKNGRLASAAEGEAVINVRNPEYKVVKNLKVKLDRWGGFKTLYKSDVKGKRGFYDFLLKYKRQSADTYATIDYYQPNKMKLNISNLKEYYSARDIFMTQVSGQYLSGNPMANDKVAYQLSVRPVRHYPGFSEKPQLSGYHFGLDERLARGHIRSQIKTALDGKGKYSYSYPLGKHQQTNFLGRLVLEANGETREGKEFFAFKESYYFPIGRVVGIKLPFYVPLKEGLIADLVMVTPSGKLTSGTCRTTLYKMEYKKTLGGSFKQELKEVQVFDDFQINQKKKFKIKVKEPGRYLVRCDTFGPDKRILSSSRFVSVWSYSGRSREEKFALDFEKNRYQVGDTVRFFIRSPGSGLGLLTVEKDHILEKRTIQLHNTTPVEINIGPSHFPQLRVRVMGIFKNGVIHQATKIIAVESSHKRFTVNLKVATEVKPAAEAKVKIRVTGADKKGRRAKVFVYCVDEGNLSLSAYQVPNLYGSFYQNLSYWRSPWLAAPVVISSMGKDRWRFYHPQQDVVPGSQGVFGRVVKSDGEPFDNVNIKLFRKKDQKSFTTASSTQGYYYFNFPAKTVWDLKFDVKGYKPHYYVLRRGYGLVVVNVVMFTDKEFHKPARFSYSGADKITSNGGEIAVQGVAGSIDARSTSVAHEMSMAPAAPALMKGKKGGGRQRKRLQGIRIRQNFKEVLFYKVVETDNSGRATVKFKTSDSLSTFRIMAVAYNQDQMGSGEKGFLVSKKLLLEEAMPEFARQKDRFKGGVQVSNRKRLDLRVEVVAKPQGITILGDAEKRFVLAAKKNQLVQFDWLADTVGEANINFYALARGADDGVLKNLPVYENFVPETQLDFDVGKEFNKGILPVKNAYDYQLNLTLASSIVKPARGIAQKLIRYPYGCLEQRTSRAMPFLVMENQFIEALGLEINMKGMRQKIQKYLNEIPKFRHHSGSLCYYPDGRYGSDYLTLYVLWAMKLARAKDFSVDEKLMKEIEEYLSDRTLKWGNPSFYQYLLSMDKRASKKQLKELFEKRDELSWQGKAFFMRAINNQLQDKAMINTMIQELNNQLQIEADFAYFEHGGKYYRSMPFYSSRYATALLLQAILEVKGKYPMAPRIVRWLLEVKSYYWHTTQTNFWILYAIQEYVRNMEELGRKTVAVNFLDVKREKVLEKLGDRLLVGKKISRIEKEFDVYAKADKQIYLTTQLSYKLAKAPAKSRGIKVIRNIYNKKGVKADTFRKGEVYMVELLVSTDKEVPYGVIDEPLAAGFEVMRQDIATGRKLVEFNKDNIKKGYYYPWLRQENAADRTVFYSYRLNGRARIIYFIKAMYSGEFTWLPCLVQGMYHPQYFGRTGFSKVKIME